MSVLPWWLGLGLVLLVLGLELEPCVAKRDPPRPGEIHPQGAKQPPPVFPEGYVMPDGSRVDPANDHKYQADSSEPRETRGRDRLLTAVYLADVSTVDGLLEEEESGLLGPVAQVQVNRLEVTNSRNALMQCAFDPQSNHTWMLDNNCTTIAKRLVGAGANVSHIDKHGWNAIAFGAMKGFTKYVKYLLGKGADIDNKDSAGRTPLMKAVTHGHVNTTQILLEGGADVSIVDSHGWSALHFSTRQLGDTMPAHYMKIFKMLVHIDSPTLSVRQQDKKGKAKKSKDNSQVTTKKPIKSRKKLPIDAKDSDGRTALMYATLMNSNELISLLLEAGADPTVEDSQGLTAYALSRVELTRVQLAQASADWATRQHEEWLRRREARNPHLNKETCAASQP